MNTTDTPTITTTIAAAITAVVRRVGVVVAAAVLATLAGMFATTAPASAAVADPGRPGNVEFTLTCSPGKISINPMMSVQSGYTRGQYMTYRYYLTNSYGYKGQSGWASNLLMPYAPVKGFYGGGTPYGLWPHTAANLNAARGALWSVQVQVGYYTAAGWSYSNWFAPKETSVWQNGSYYYTAPWAGCTT